MMMLALLAIPFAMQAQTQYHDIELNEATGPVKKMIVNVMGYDQITTFSKEGKMEREGMSEAVYDADGYLQSAKMQMMGRDITSKRTYNDKGAVATESIDMDGQAMSTPYTDYKYDDHGNWISRKVSMMGQEMEQNRTIEYYE